MRSPRLLCCLTAFLCWTGLLSAAPIVVERTIHADQPRGTVEPLWRFFGYDEPNYSYHPEGIALLRRIAASQPQGAFIRTHHLLTTGNGEPSLKWGSTNVYTEDAAGRPVYDWTILDQLFDTWRDLGLKPFVEIGFMPQALSAQPEPYTPKPIYHDEPKGLVTGGAFHPPADYAKWGALIEAWVRHAVERYGRAEVASWPWELWNEPNGGYWKGTREEFFRLHDVTAAAVKRVLPEAAFGGPHITNPDYSQGGEFLDAFLRHCVSGTNAATGGTGSPLDFIAVHAKGGTTWEGDHVRMNLGNHLLQIDKSLAIIARFPELKGRPVYLGESDPDGCAACTARLYPQNAYRNGAQFAAYTAAVFLRNQDLAAQRGQRIVGAVTWAFTFPDQPWFDGFRELATNGVPKPVFNAFRMFGRLEGTRLAVSGAGQRPLADLMATSVRTAPDVEVFATRGARRVSLVAWHYHDDGRPGPAAELRLVIDGLPADLTQVRVEQRRVDDAHGNAYTAWLQLGSPAAPTPEQRAALLAASELEPLPGPATLAVTGGRGEITLALPRQSVAQIQVEW